MSGLTTRLSGWRSKARTRLGRFEPSSIEPEPTATATHRRADLVLEIDPAAGLQTGSKVHLAVDTARLHIFDESGHRVDRVTR
jgi:multiple sugar transport system ATP-binding protein